MLSSDDFPPSPYQNIELWKVETADIITNTPNARSAYLVKEHKGDYVVCQCLYHKSLPARVGEIFNFSEVFLVKKAENCQIPAVA